MLLAWVSESDDLCWTLMVTWLRRWRWPELYSYYQWLCYTLWMVIWLRRWPWRVVHEWRWQWPCWWWWPVLFYDMVMWRGPELYTNDDGAVPAAAQTSLPVASRPSNFKSGKSALDFELTCTLLYLLRGTARHTGEISVQGLLCSTPEFYSEFFSGVYSRVSTPQSGNLQQALCLYLAPHQAIYHLRRDLIFLIILDLVAFSLGNALKGFLKAHNSHYFLINIESSK